MKKTILSIVLSIVLLSPIRAQFFEKVPYAGALDPDSKKDWTKGWTNWNPKSSSYPSVTDTLTFFNPAGEVDITATLTLDASRVYLLKSMVVVKSGGKLIIPEGTIIRGQADLASTPKQYATIVVERGGYLAINGTSLNPVVFTSNQPTGKRERGDWGGIIICGKAINNQGTDVQLEGFNNVAFNNTIAKYGGILDEDNSGSLQYLRIEFGGLAFEPNKEINGLTLGSVGKNTKVDNIQVSYSGDDSYEWFGGSVLCKHLIAFKGTDDDFDTDFGYHGAVQFGIAFKDSSYYDLSWNAPSGASTSECFESDNDAAGSGKLPYTSAIFSNMTCVGPVPAGMAWTGLSKTAQGAFRRGARIRRNSRLSIINSIFMGYRNFVMFDGDSTLTASGVKSNTFSESGNLFRNNFICSPKSGALAGTTNTGLAEVDSKNTPQSLDTWIRNSFNDNTVDTLNFTPGKILVNTTNFNSPDFRPVVDKNSKYTFAIIVPYGTWTSNIKSFNVINSSSVYPNPSSGSFTIKFESKTSFAGEIRILDLSGKTIKTINGIESSNGENAITIDLSDITNGSYIFSFVSSEASFTQNIIINR